MEGDEPKAKKRVLPQWMREDKAEAKKACTREPRKKKDRSPRKSTIYCMNEKELVDYALGILNKGKKQWDGAVESEAVAGVDEAKTDRDQNTKPPTPPEPPRSPKLSPSPSKDVTKNVCVSDEEDDPLKYVREIFFS